MSNFDNEEWHHRHSVRLRDHTYTQGSYFLTICAEEREWLFGTIRNGAMELNAFGTIVEECWKNIPQHFLNVSIDAFVVMPNHIHGILHLSARKSTPLACRGTACRAPTQRSFQKPLPGTLSTIIRSFKSAVTRRINLLRNEPGAIVWQRNFHEHIIRPSGELAHFRSYIRNNPKQWKHDEEYFPQK